MKLAFLGVAIAAGVALASGPSAFAFQFVNPDTNPDGSSSKFSTNLDQQSSSPTPNSRFHFSDGGNGNYGPSPAIQEKFLQSPASRTVPSQGW